MSWIENMSTFMSQSWVGTSLSIIAIPLAISTYVLSRKRTKMAYVHLGEHLLGSASDALPPGIVVEYVGLSIPRLTKTVLVLWNSGEATVSGSDIVEKDPLRLAVGDDGEILSVAVLKASRPVNDFQVLPTRSLVRNEVRISFDYLDSKDGAVIEVLHTSSDRKPLIKGNVRGLPHGVKHLGQFARPKARKPKGRTGLIGSIATAVLSPPVFAIAGLATAFYGMSPDAPVRTEANSSLVSALAGGLAGFCFMWVISQWSSRRKYPRNLQPENLD